ncbi:MAG: RNA polymerase sigma-70 factor [Tannerella sp.]|jgi:RNA polymerase sigma-70 factor (ECF subfamily)|nr:RNA polymerase sigma-70 factor [Tannerella sp.]
MEAFTAEEFERSFKELYRPLCLFALRITNRLEDAEDVVQQAFADVWEKRRTMAKIDNLKAYMYQAVRNRSLSFVEKAEHTCPIDEYADMEDPPSEEPIDCAERDARLWDALDRLPPERKKIFLLSKRDGLKYQEIADRLNLSVKTVENQIGKALKTLRETVVRVYFFFFG